MKRRTGIIIALAAVAMLALAGCSGGDDNAATAEPAAPSTPASAPVEPEAPKITAIEDALQRGVEIAPPTESDEKRSAGVHRTHQVAQQPAPHNDGVAG